MAPGIRALITGLMAAALWTGPVVAQPNDPRATDAVAFFGGMCGSVVAEWSLPLDHDKYQFRWLSPEDAAEFGDDLKDLVVWAVTASDSEAHMLHYVTPGGICGVELQEGDGKTVDKAFEALVDAAGKAMSLKPVLLSDNREDGSRTRIWRLGEAGNGYEFGLSVSIEGDRPPQALMTMSEAPDRDKL